MARWDVERLLRDCDLRELARYVGIRTKKCGSTTFIECLSGMHHETDINHCVCRKDWCYCFTCHGAYQGHEHNDAIATIRQFRRVYGGDDSFDAACETIAGFLGGRDRYILNDTGQRRQVKLLPFTPEELQAAGVSSDPYAKRILQELYERDEAFLKEMLLKKLETGIRKLKRISEACDPELAGEASRMLVEGGKMYWKLTGKALPGRCFRA